MANSIKLLKNGVTDVVYRVVNDSATSATFTITLSSLARSEQTISGTPSVGISSIVYCTSGNISISRNSKVLYYFAANSGEHSNAYSTDYDQKTSDISITITSGVATIRLLKGPEYKNA